MTYDRQTSCHYNYERARIKARCFQRVAQTRARARRPARIMRGWCVCVYERVYCVFKRTPTTIKTSYMGR